MNKKVLAVSIGAVLAIGFIAPAMMNAQAQVSTESATLKNILGIAKRVQKNVDITNSELSVIKDDLLLKKKFYQFHPFTVSSANSVALINDGCSFSDPSACAFNVESILIEDFTSQVCVEEVIVDNVSTDISALGICTPTNLLLEWGVDKLGVSQSLEIVFDGPLTGTVEFNGEKPQGMILRTATD
jgi:hypothetical protein